MDYMFKDAAGTIPAKLPGDTVARIVRRAGTVDAAQATASKRPVLARWPKGGRRNLVVTDLRQWMKANGMTVTAGLPDPVGGFDAYRITFPGPNVSLTYTTPADLIAGVDTSSTSLFYDFWWRGEAGRKSESSFCGYFSVPTYTGEWEHVTGSRVLGAWSRNNSLGTWGGGSTLPTSFIDVYRPRCSLVSLAPYQDVWSNYDVTEAGVADIWHLAADGVDDALPVTLSAGTYGRAWVDHLGAVSIDSVTLASEVPVDLLLGPRVADVIYRAGAFTAAEQAALRAYWGGIYK